MKFDIELGGTRRTIEVWRDDKKTHAILDGTEIDADVVEITPQFYSVLMEGRSFEVHIETQGGSLRVFAAGREFSAAIHDPREWRPNREGAAQAEGRQQIRAPMPGKVVRVLAKAGEAVEAGQGLLVVEAMKMQNEIRSPRSGRIEGVLVAEGQAVAAGEVVAVVS